MTKRVFFIFVLLSIFSFLYAHDDVIVIKKGDTLYAISKKYKVSIADILKKNDITDPAQIKAGQKIFIPIGNTVKQDDVVMSNNLDNKNLKHYTIRKGDSLFALAKKFGVRFSDLLKINNLTDKSIIKIGQIINIPQLESVKKTVVSNKQRTKETADISLKRADSTLLWPVPATKVSYLSGKISGVVIDSKEGQSVKAVTSGKVVSTGSHRGFGQVVFVQSKTKHIFVYGGLSKVIVKKGSTVKVGHKLGNLGTGLFTGDAKLYFMVYNKNKPIDPAKAPRGF